MQCEPLFPDITIDNDYKGSRFLFEDDNKMKYKYVIR